MVGFKALLTALSTLLLFGACVPQTKQTQCKSNEAFNATLRTCVPSSGLVGNNRPVIGADQILTPNEDAAINFTVNSAIDVDGNSLYYVVVSSPNYGTLTNCMNKSGSEGLADLSCTYTPIADYYGPDSFTYKVNDGFEDSTGFAVVNLAVTTVDDIPVADAISKILMEDVPGSVALTYTDTEGDLATSCSVDALNNVTTGGCTCTMGFCSVPTVVNAAANENSSRGTTFSFTYQVRAGGNYSVAKTVTISVLPVNDDPVITPPTCTSPFNQDAALACAPQPVVTDPDTLDIPADVIIWSLDTTNTCTWVAQVASTGVLSGAPTDNNVGTCVLGLKVTDASARTDTDSTVSLTINNRVPVLTDNTIAVPLTKPTEDAGTQIIGGVSSNAVCTKSFCLTIDKVSQGTLTFAEPGTTCDSNGTLAFTAVDADNKNITYTPNENHAAAAIPCTIEIAFDDGNTGTDSASSTFLVSEINDQPTLNVATIPAQTTNEATTFVVDSNLTTAGVQPLIIDEGGALDEDIQGLTVKVTSSNTVLVPQTVTNILMYSNSSFTTAYSGGSGGVTGVSYAAPTGNNENLYLVIRPVAGQTGTSTITVTITDNGTTAGVAAAQVLPNKTFVLTVTNSASVHEDWTHAYATGAKMLHDGTVEEEPVVTLSWNNFTAFNDTITGYNVYRSTSSTGPFLNPINSVPVTTTALTYTDSTLTSADVGIAYYYRVMAISNLNTLPMDTTSSYASLRILIPQHNMALVHRRIANKEVCTTTGLTSDKLNNNRCAYVGPGDAQSGYYDIGYDHLVDRYEASCNYTVNTLDCISTGGVGCIGNGTPAAVLATVTSPSGKAIYYDRSTGTCYYYSAAWKAISTLTSAELNLFAEFNQSTQETVPKKLKAPFPKRPPLTRVQQFLSNNYCKAPLIHPISLSINSVADNTRARRLMSRKVHIASAAWAPTAVTPATLEEGSSLSLTTSQCNSSNGGVLDFQDGLISALYDTWTATETSASTSHNFVMAGSTVTAFCQSRYGIQDLIGNVEEWNSDRLFDDHAADLYYVGVTTTQLLDPVNTDFLYNIIATPKFWNIDTTVPAADFELEAGSNEMTYIYLPLGLPTAPPAVAGPTYTPLGNSTLASTLSILNNDKFYIDPLNYALSNGDGIADDGELIGAASGGHFADTAGAGRFTMRARSICSDVNDNGDCTDAGDISSSATEENVYTGFRCMIRVP